MRKKLFATGFWALAMLVVFTGCALFGPTIERGDASKLTFNANGGIGTVPDSQIVEKGASFIIPEGEGLSFGDAAFVGWYSYSNGIITNYSAGESFTPPGGYFTLYARWELEGDDFDSISGFTNKLAWLLNNAKNGQSYTFELNANENIGPQSLLYPGRDNITIILRGIGENRTISSAVMSNKLFDVYPGVMLVLDNNVTLLGHSSNKTELVWVGGRFRMNNGSSIIGNGSAGVFVRGIFEMNGGTISGNRSSGFSGGGVNVGAIGTFTMNGGTISNNRGDGVFIWNDGTFIMNNGFITGNTGDGVHVYYDATFRKIGGTVSGNNVK